MLIFTIAVRTIDQAINSYCCNGRMPTMLRKSLRDSLGGDLIGMSYEEDPGWQFLRQSQEQLLAATTKKFDSKKNVWVSDTEDGFIAAEIKSLKGDNIIVVTSKGTERTLKKDDAQQMNPPKFEKTEDMANLTFLNDASVLHNLRQRYYSMMIYSVIYRSVEYYNNTKYRISMLVRKYLIRETI
uniref:Myosin N-terminal SH3-like domain-containing protein n=1 Tax=Heterorhabditis bacteriophora TaxID=37862 RepID=A0A1I7XM24_HETBA